jgi:rhomboid protease GluP
MLDDFSQSEATLVRSDNWLTQKPNNGALLTVLISIFSVVLGAYVHWYDFLGLASHLVASPKAVFTDHQYWRLWTTLFVHADFSHLVSNLFLFGILGFLLSGYFGPWLFPIAAITAGGLTNFLVLSSMPVETRLVGLSGVVFWMGGAWLTLYFLIETRKTVSQKLLRTIGISLVLFMPSEAFDPSISYRAHGYGFVLGILFGGIYFLKNFRVYQLAIVNTYTVKFLEPLPHKFEH